MSNVEPIHQPDRGERESGGIEILISNLLRGGVIISLALILVGLVLLFLREPERMRGEGALEGITRVGTPFPHTLADVARGVAGLQGEAVAMAGLLLLIATPVVRVFVSIFAFVQQRDRRFVVITSVVLAMLLLSFFLGRVE